MNEPWPELTLEEATERSELEVTVLGRPARQHTFRGAEPDQYAQLVRVCFPTASSAAGLLPDATRRPVKFALTVMNERDLGREGLTLDRVIAVCAGYVGAAIETTAADRKRFEKQVYEAGVKRRGGDLSGRAGTGNSR